MLRKTEGIVLRGIPFGEADIIATYLTLDFGLQKAFAKSPRKTKSRFGASLEPFTHVHLGVMGREDSPLPRLTQSDIIRPHQCLRETLRSMVALSELAELTLALMPESKPNEPVFRLMESVLDRMDAAPDMGLYPLAYKVRFLELKGYAPSLGACGICGAREARDFYPSLGTMVCRDCKGRAEGAYVRISPGSVRVYEAIAGWELAKLPRLRASAGLMAEVRAMLEAHLGHVLTRPLRSRDAAFEAAAG